MIKEFHDTRTALLFQGRVPKRMPPDLVKSAKQKLQQLNATATLEFLRSPPGNHLEALAGDRAGQHSIRVNDQWRICFKWKDGNATRVEFCDYH